MECRKLEVLRQYNLFSTANAEKTEVVRKLPYKFSYRFEDISGKSSTLMIEDWEIGALFWNLIAQHEGDEKERLMEFGKSI